MYWEFNLIYCVPPSSAGACAPASGLCASVLSMMMAKDSTYAASALPKRPGLSRQYRYDAAAAPQGEGGSRDGKMRRRYQHGVYHTAETVSAHTHAVVSGIAVPSFICNWCRSGGVIRSVTGGCWCQQKIQRASQPTAVMTSVVSALAALLSAAHLCKLLHDAVNLLCLSRQSKATQ